MKNKLLIGILVVLIFMISLISLPVTMGNAISGGPAGGVSGSCGKANYVSCDDNSDCCSKNCCNNMCISSKEECVVTGDDLEEAEKTIIKMSDNTIFLEFTNKDGEEYYHKSERKSVFCYSVPTDELGLCEDIICVPDSPFEQYCEKSKISKLGRIENGEIILETEKGATIIVDSSEYKISFVEEDGNVIETKFVHNGEKFKMSDITGFFQGRTDYGSYIYQTEKSVIIYYLKTIISDEKKEIESTKEGYCEQDEDCRRIFGICNCDYKTEEECKSHGGQWQMFSSCLAIGCPPPSPPCCECQVKCINNKCELTEEEIVDEVDITEPIEEEKDIIESKEEYVPFTRKILNWIFNWFR